MERIRAVTLVALLCISLAVLSSCISSGSTAKAPTITTMTIPSTATIGQAYAGATINTSGGTIPLTYTVVSGALPVGLGLNSNNNQGNISGTPGKQSTGPYTFTIQVKDSNNPARIATQQYTITLSNPAVPSVQCPTGNATPCVLPAGTAGVSYNATFTATGGSPFTWTATGLPSGLNLNPVTGILSGIPSQVGTIPFTVNVTDVVGQISPSLQCTITIAAATPALAITPPGALPSGTVNVAYGPNGVGVELTATGGLPPYVWFQGQSNPGKIPPGLGIGNLSNTSSVGLISGIPTTATGSPFTFQVEVADSESPQMTANVSVTITINPAGAAACPVGHEAALAGTFAYLMKGFDANGAVAIAGSFQADGTGKIMGGAEDINRAGTGPQVNLPIDPGGSSYTLGADSRGCLMVATAAGLQTFRFSLAGFANGAPTEGNIIEFDDNSGTGTRGSGIIRAQDASSFSNDKFASSYAFGLSGFGAAGEHVALAGRLTSDGNGNIVGGNFDRNDAGSLTANSSKLSGTYSIPAGSTTGRGTVNATFNGTPFTFAAYMVNGGEMILASVDQISATNQVISGEAIASAGPFSNATLTGSHLIRASALNRSGSNPGARATIGVLTFDGKSAGGVTGTLFDDEAGMKRTTNILRGAATYSVDQNTGRITFTGAGTDSPVGYVTRTGSGVTAFLVGTDSGSADGALEFQSGAGANFKTSALAGTYSFGTDENVDYSTANETHVARFTSSTATASGMSDQSQPRANGLLGSQPYSQPFAFNVEGIGTAGTNPAVTNGTRIFFIEETATTNPSITVAEKQ
jgi:putative Ig domain-containing protein